MFAKFIWRSKCLLKSFPFVRKKNVLNYMWKRTGQPVCLFCFWDYPDYLWQINLVLDTYQPLLPSPSDTPPPLWPTITFYPESSYRTGDRAGSERSHLIGAHSGMRRCGRRDWDGIGSDLRQWEETLTMNVLRTHVYNDGGERGNWSCSGALTTVSFWSDQIQRDILITFHRACKRGFCLSVFASYCACLCGYVLVWLVLVVHVKWSCDCLLWKIHPYCLI